MAKHFTIFIPVLAAFIIFSETGCEKDPYICSDATVVNLGPPEVDGCGWIIRIDSVDYRPENLPSSYMQDQLEIRISYTLLNSRSHCGWMPSALKKIRILDVCEKK